MVRLSCTRRPSPSKLYEIEREVKTHWLVAASQVLSCCATLVGMPLPSSA